MGNNPSLAEANPELAKQWHPTKNGNITPFDVSEWSHSKVWWFLPYDDPVSQKHFDFEWEATVASRSSGQNCPFLSGKGVWKGFNDLATTHPDLSMQWHPSKNGNLTPFDVSSGSGFKVWWLYPYDDPQTDKHFDFEWEAVIGERTSKPACPFLSGARVWSGYNDLSTKYPAVAKQWHPNKNGELSPQTIYAKSTQKIWWLYPYDDPKTGKHFDFEWQASVYDRTVGKSCLENGIHILRIPYIYDPISDKIEIISLIKNFIKSKKVPAEILAFYRQFDFSNYYDVALKLNSL